MRLHRLRSTVTATAVIAGLATLSGAAVAANAPRVELTAAATYGFQLKFLFGATGTGNNGAPAIGAIRLKRPSGVSVTNPTAGREIGKLVYTKTQSTVPQDQTVVRLRSAGRTATGFVLADTNGTRAVLHPDRQMFLSITMHGAHKPRLYLNAYGSRLLRFDPCVTATFVAQVFQASRQNSTASMIQPKALRRAGLCR